MLISVKGEKNKSYFCPWDFLPVKFCDFTESQGILELLLSLGYRHVTFFAGAPRALLSAVLLESLREWGSRSVQFSAVLEVTEITDFSFLQEVMKCFGCHVAHHKQNLWDPKESSNKKDVLCSSFSNKKEAISTLEGRIQRSNLRHFREGVQIETCCSLVRSNLREPQKQSHHWNCSQRE